MIIELFINGLAFGLSYGPVFGMTLSKVPVTDAADASGVLITMLQLGQVLGVALLGTLYLTLLTHHLPAHAVAITFLAVSTATLAAACAGIVLTRSSGSRLPKSV